MLQKPLSIPVVSAKLWQAVGNLGGIGSRRSGRETEGSWGVGLCFHSPNCVLPQQYRFRGLGILSQTVAYRVSFLFPPDIILILSTLILLSVTTFVAIIPKLFSSYKYLWGALYEGHYHSMRKHECRAHNIYSVYWSRACCHSSWYPTAKLILPYPRTEGIKADIWLTVGQRQPLCFWWLVPVTELRMEGDSCIEFITLKAATQWSHPPWAT